MAYAVNPKLIRGEIAGNIPTIPKSAIRVSFPPLLIEIKDAVYDGLSGADKRKLNRYALTGGWT